MHSEERLQRMEADGILTPAQAAMLRDSLNWGDAGEHTAASPRSSRRAATKWIFAIVAVLALFVVFIAMNFTGSGDQVVQDVAVMLNDPGGIGNMNKGFSGVLAVALLLIVPLLIWAWLHNGLVSKEETVFEAWAQTESNLERRADLIPALVDTVARYLRHESETLTAVTEQRAGAGLEAALDELIAAQAASADLIREDAGDIVESEAGLTALYSAHQKIGQRMQRFIAVAESYPQLRSSDQFLELQAQLEGTENRINVARMRFNESVGTYNAAIRRLPASLIAGIGGFRRKAYFQADDDSRDAPELAFD